jgi:hypothetical protein
MVSNLVLVAYGYSSFLSTSSAIISASTKQNQRQNRGVTVHNMLKLVLLSNSYSFLPSTEGRTTTNCGTCEILEERFPGESKICSSENFVVFWESCTQL